MAATSTPLILGALFLGLGGVFLLVQVVLIVRRWGLERRGTWTTGVVVDRSRDSAPNIVVRFRDHAGVERDARSLGGSTGFPEIGEASRVLFDNAQPERHVLEEDLKLQRWLFPLLILVFGGVGAALLGSALGVTR